MEMIPTLDLSHFIEGGEQQRRDFADGLLSSLIKTGFVKIINHGLDEKKLEEVFTWSKTFFHQSAEQKNEIANKPGPKPVRGYSGVSVEYVSRLVDDKTLKPIKDSKEHFDTGSANDWEFPNQWPASQEFQGFRPFMEALYEKGNSICLLLLQALEISLNLKPGSLEERSIPHAADLRLTHYPEISIEEMRSGLTSRIAPHSDWGIITLLFQDSTGGLEVENRACPGHFFPVEPNDITEMIVNAGDTLMRWTNGKVVSGIHQVMVPERLKKVDGVILPERYSIAHLFKAQRQVSIGPLSQFVTTEVPAKYPDMTALQYHRQVQNLLFN
ncbi:putative gibberellin 2-oxidase [Rosellinia necatrix]|uniref:Putative gibberellin 2-oxidase n=1 Tax=Rosellinia necatrix TaxID=77044 RepID=A0A1W2TXE4_ROSNE|nr:putative gibberellin 2-oxidase [Rosellinia necatrix]